MTIEEELLMTVSEDGKLAMDVFQEQRGQPECQENEQRKTSAKFKDSEYQRSHTASPTISLLNVYGAERCLDSDMIEVVLSCDAATDHVLLAASRSIAMVNP